MQESIKIFFCINTLWHVSLTEKNVRNCLPLPFAQETSFFSAFLHGFSGGSKNYSVVSGVICDVTTAMYVGISVDWTVKSLCGLEMF